MKQEFELYAEIVSEPQFVCTRCGRAANRGDNLCDPRSIHPAAPSGGPRSLIEEILARRQPAGLH